MASNYTYQQKITDYARTDFTALNKNLTVDEALKKIREEGVGERIIYFYVVDDDEKLVGVLPTRRILTANMNQNICDIMVSRVAALPGTATVYDACEFFVTYKFLAFPVIDEDGKIIGIVDVNLFTEELLNLEPDIEERSRIDNVFETIGFNISEIKSASPLRALKIRLPWLLATVTSGTLCALLAGIFEATLAESLVIAFFLTLVLGLGESVSIQSMTLTIQTLRTTLPSLKWYLKNLFRETQVALLLGVSCGLIVAAVVLIWKGAFMVAVAIGASIMCVELIAAFWGLSIPALLHKRKLDPKISAGPMTLAITDISTIVFYLGLASSIL